MNVRKSVPTAVPVADDKAANTVRLDDGGHFKSVAIDGLLAPAEKFLHAPSAAYLRELATELGRAAARAEIRRIRRGAVSVLDPWTAVLLGIVSIAVLACIAVGR